MKLSEYSFNDAIDRLLELPKEGRILTFSIDSAPFDILVEFDLNRALWVKVSKNNLSSALLSSIETTMKAKADDMPELLKYIPSDSFIQVHIHSDNPYTAESVCYQLFSEVAGYEDDTEVQMSKNYVDVDPRDKIFEALKNLSPSKKVKIISGTWGIIVGLDTLHLSLVGLSEDQVDEAEQWFSSIGWSLWDHDNGTCPQLVSPGQDGYDALDLEFNANIETACRYAYSFFLRVAELNIDFPVEISPL